MFRRIILQTIAKVYSCCKRIGFSAMKVLFCVLDDQKVEIEISYKSVSDERDQCGPGGQVEKKARLL